MFSCHVFHGWLVGLFSGILLSVTTMAESRVTMADGPPAKKAKTASPATAPVLDSSGINIFVGCVNRTIA